MEKIIYISRMKALLYAFGTLLFSVMFFVMMFSDDFNPDTFIKFVLVIGFFLCGFVGLYYLYLFLVKHPMYEINKKGILFKKKLGVKREFFISWHEIIYVMPDFKEKNITVSVKDFRKYGRSATGDRLGKGIFMMNLKLCDVSVKDLVPLLKKYVLVLTHEDAERLLNKQK